MSRILLALFVLGAAATFAATSSKNSDLEKAVKAELLRKTFTTKILVGTYVPCPQRRRDDGMQTVETDLSPEGVIRYFALPNCLYGPIPTFGDGADIVLFGPARDIAPPVGGYSISPGTAVDVENVSFKSGGIVVRLHAVNDHYPYHVYGEITYLLEKDYRTWSTERLVEVIDRGILIPAYEKLYRLNAEFDALRASFEQAENKYNLPGGTAASRLANAIALKQVLENLQKNRAEFTAMGKTDPQAGVYSEKLNALAQETTKLAEEAHEDRVAQVRGQLQAQLPALSAIQTQVRQNPPSTVAEWQQRSDSLDKYSTLLDERQKLLDKLKSENEAPSPEDAKNMNESRAEIQTDRASLQNEHQQIELADLTAQFRELTRKRAQMLDAYSRAFATPKEKSALQSLIAVLDQMVANRDQAAGLGDEAAQTQLIKCRAEADKYKRK